eukprot:3031390-Rhodomonas_salina.1
MTLSNQETASHLTNGIAKKTGIGSRAKPTSRDNSTTGTQESSPEASNAAEPCWQAPVKMPAMYWSTANISSML